jgi:citrate lyase subunit beta / citryl-CoA lyase
MLRRSQLFVPANDERKLRKSIALEADSIIIDLEDSVPFSEKSNARALLAKLFRELDWGRKEVCLRINKVGSIYAKEDLEFVKKQEKVGALVLPKAESIPGIIYRRTGKTMIPLIETAKGITNVQELARCDGVVAVSYGPADLANSVGGRTEAYSQNNFVKTKIIIEASAYGVDAIDGVYFDLDNIDGFRREANESRDLGYVGKHVIHPSQIAIANEIYSPSQSEVEEATKIIETYEKALGKNVGAIRLDDKLVDAVHYRRANAVITRAKEIANSEIQ